MAKGGNDDRAKALQVVFEYLKSRDSDKVRQEFKPQKGGYYCPLVEANAFSITLQMAETGVAFLLVGDVVSQDGFGAWLKTKQYKIELEDVGEVLPRREDEKQPKNNIGNVYRYNTTIEWKNVEEDNNKESIYYVYNKIIESLKAVEAFDLPRPKNKNTSVSTASIDNELRRNLIVFGAPGTGKSNHLKKESARKIDNGDGIKKDFFEKYERVTFYPTYSYAQFVGSYKPVMKDVDKEGFEVEKPKEGERTRKAIAYEFVPGPFLRILKNALRNEDKNYLLIIEEINRANAAAVFGDVFQLLDRASDARERGGFSEYSITPSCEIVEYLMREDKDGDGIEEDKARELKIPSNMYIWATMNSADQGVFPLDTAFKRRWDFEYMSLDKNTSNDKCDVAVGRECTCKWGELRKAINDILKRNHVNEDKLLSSSFVKPDIISPDKISLDQFTMKVLMYLWEDAARMYRQSVFADGLGALSDLMDAWEKLKPDGEPKKVDLTKVFKSIEKVEVKMNEQKEEGAQEAGSDPKNAQLKSEEVAESPETSEEGDEVNQSADDNAADESNRGEQSDQNEDSVSSERTDAASEDSDTVKS